MSVSEKNVFLDTALTVLLAVQCNMLVSLSLSNLELEALVVICTYI